MAYNIDMQAVELSGVVTPFQGNGRQLGYPTANITTETELADGVYFGFADLDPYQNHPAIIFIGVPTTMGNYDRRVEAYLLDITDTDYYDKELKLIVQHFHRPNQTFDGAEELVRAMRDDEAQARQWFGLS